MSAHFVIYFMHLSYDTYLLMSQTILFLYMYICFLCMHFVVITTLLFIGLRVTYMYLYSFFLTLFSTQYYIYFAILFCFVFVKQTTSLGMT